MITPAPRHDPLQSRVSRVEKHRRPKKALPEWYYRFLRIEMVENREPDPEDFDEDLSEIEEIDEQEKEPAECECDSDNSECECDLEDVDSVDEESEKSYDGSDAEYYYELKDEREERKRELLEQQRRDEKEKEQMIEFEKPKFDEARAAYDSFKKGKKMPMKSIIDQGFKLFSLDHIDRFYAPIHPTKRVDFYYMDERLQRHGKKLDKEAEQLVYGDLYVDSEANCGFGPFRLPTGTSHELKVKSDDNKYDLWFEFIGNGNEYLKLSVSSDLVSQNRIGSPSTAPDMFEFFGVLRDTEKEMKERQEWQERAKQKARNRSSSPRESWFERNHSMGLWNS